MKNRDKKMKNVNNDILKVGFWFGKNKPENKEDSVYSAELDFSGNDKGYTFSKFEKDYELFKIKNVNPDIPYKNCIDNEECIIFFPEPVGPQLTTFNELRLIDNYIKALDRKIYESEKQKKSVNELVNNENYGEIKVISIDEIFNSSQIEMIEYLYNLSIKNNSSYQKLLEEYFETFKEELELKGIHYKYVSYAISYSIKQEMSSLSFTA